MRGQQEAPQGSLSASPSPSPDIKFFTSTQCSIPVTCCLFKPNKISAILNSVEGGKFSIDLDFEDPQEGWKVLLSLQASAKQGTSFLKFIDGVLKLKMGFLFLPMKEDGHVSAEEKLNNLNEIFKEVMVLVKQKSNSVGETPSLQSREQKGVQQGQVPSQPPAPEPKVPQTQQIVPRPNPSPEPKYFRATYGTVKVTVSCCVYSQHGASRSAIGDSRGWMAKNRENTWIQFSSAEPRRWCRVRTQGQGHYNRWVVSYTLEYSGNGLRWTSVGNGKIFQGNTDANTIVVQDITPPVQGMFLRLRPLRYASNVAMRADAFCLV